MHFITQLDSLSASNIVYFRFFQPKTKNQETSPSTPMNSPSTLAQLF